MRKMSGYLNKRILVSGFLLLISDVLVMIFFPGLLLISLLLLPTFLFWFLGGICQKTGLKIVLLNMAVLLTLVVLTESFFVVKEYRNFGSASSVVEEDVYPSEPDPVLGWRLLRNVTKISRKSVDDQLVYEAKVTINSDGLRWTPGCLADHPEAVLFFGNSCTYGEGVHDSMTLPSQFGLLVRDSFQVYNFGVFGYGPHQTLAQIQTGMVDRVVQYPVRHVVMQVIYPEHVYRLLGQFDWNQNSPCYRKDVSGKLVFCGLFSDQKRKKNRSSFLGSHSALYRYFFKYPYTLSARDKELFADMLLEGKSLLNGRYQNPHFHLIVWNWSMDNDSEIFSMLEREGFSVYDAHDIFPKDPASSDYRISPYDTHPNKEAYRILAGFLLEKIKKGMK